MLKQFLGFVSGELVCMTHVQFYAVVTSSFIVGAFVGWTYKSTRKR